jgi:PTS system nitrogen regulatory IIA component
MTKLSDILHPDLICTNLKSSAKKEVLSELGRLLAGPGGAPDAAAITTALLDRERLATTGVGEGVAIPHAKLENLEGNRIAVGISRAGIPFDAVDGEPVHIFFALIAPLASAGDHLRILAQISRLLKEHEVRERLVDTRDAASLIAAIRGEDGKQ